MRRLYGMMAEFRSPDALLAAARAAGAAGYRDIEAYAPFPVEGLAEAVGFRRNRVPLATLAGAVAGAAGGYFMQWYAAVVSFPINVGGRPLHSWPMFIPVAFELAILCGALAAVVSMLAANGLPRLTHPVFDAPGFGLASRDRFFLCLPLRGRPADDWESRDVAAFLRGLEPAAVCEVPR